MKRSFFLGLLFIMATPAWAIDLGPVSGGAASEAAEVKVVNEEPVPVAISATGLSQLLEITASVQLEKDEDYRSPYLDVQGYRTVSFFVIPVKVLNEPQADIQYRLDAFFGADAATADYKKFGKEDSELIGGGGSQQFGAVEVEGLTEKAMFTKLTTGVTGGDRVLTIPVYGPFVRIVLTNLTEDDRRKFRIAAYMTR